MDRAELIEHAREAMDGDLSSVVSVEFNGVTFLASLSKGYVEIGEISGVRSTLLCIDEDVENIDQGDEVVIEGVTYKAQAFEKTGRVYKRIVLGR